jgi:hypothetical protein
MVIDELSRVKEKSWNALKTTISVTGGTIKMIANPRGKKNWFNLLCQEAKEYASKYDKAIDKKKLFAYYHLSSLESPFVKLDEIEMYIAQCSGLKFADIYEIHILLSGSL